MFVLFIFLLYFDVYTEGNVIEVTESGILTLKQNDMVVIFYVTLRHHGQQPVRTMITMVECCQKITEDDTDCDLMDLHGGDFGILKPGAVKNFSLIYPNMYGYNRKGVCTVKVLYHCVDSTENMDVYHRIEFDTTVSTKKVPRPLKGWYTTENIIPCESPDQDPFDHCNPVNCNLKYSGTRNYYNRKWKVCQRAPTCIADPKKAFPDVAYVPFNNKCKKLENAITEADLELLRQSINNNKSFTGSVVNIRCHHGEINPKTGLCICDPGWKSLPFDPELFEKNDTKDSFYSMCDIKCGKDSNIIIPALLGLCLGFWLSFCVICCEKYDYFLMCYRNDPVFDQTGAYFPLGGENTECGAGITDYGLNGRDFVSDFSIPECNMGHAHMY